MIPKFEKSCNQIDERFILNFFRDNLKELLFSLIIFDTFLNDKYFIFHISSLRNCAPFFGKILINRSF